MEAMIKAFVESIGGPLAISAICFYFLYKKDQIIQELLKDNRVHLEKMSDNFVAECKAQKEDCSAERKKDREAFERRLQMAVSNLR